ncbi:hypothetical protein Lbir_0186 [Legionella birminghamensis]|uniref:Uncharacterized protein n=1 Tax=Legionella birminghamensis TaxID=28083 RepID=A0A378IAP4_9GAMM|nr:hypothetical protein [Legionella birminghamensis]KTC76117.1 hypothetical protein Lbir_0186 [Legionella birminghamensis]STX32259.1 Uncharacterised protein [Legionella birminghamensis]
MIISEMISTLENIILAYCTRQGASINPAFKDLPQPSKEKQLQELIKLAIKPQHSERQSLYEYTLQVISLLSAIASQSEPTGESLKEAQNALQNFLLNIRTLLKAPQESEVTINTGGKEIAMLGLLVKGGTFFADSYCYSGQLFANQLFSALKVDEKTVSQVRLCEEAAFCFSPLENRVLSKNIKALETRIENLNGQLSSTLNDKGSISQQADKLRSQRDMLVSEKEDALKKLAESEALAERHLEQSRQIQAENSEKDQIITAQQEEIAHLKKALAESKKECEKLGKENEKLHEDISAMKLETPIARTFPPMGFLYGTPGNSPYSLFMNNLQSRGLVEKKKSMNDSDELPTLNLGGASFNPD